MKPLTPVGLLLAAFLSLSMPGCSSASRPDGSTFPQPTEVGENTYSLTRKAGSVLANHRKLKDRVTRDAAEYCMRTGRTLEVVSVDVAKVGFLGSDEFSTATIVFKAIPPMRAEAPVAMTAPVKTTPTDTLYAELLKLDELRQKGILTEDEFAAQKKKLLERAD